MQVDRMAKRAKPQLVLSGAVAKILGLSKQMVYNLDDDLRPTRTATGTRIYDPVRVEAVRAAREERKAKGA